MHELSITENILSIALDAAAGAQAQRITAINLVIGELSSIVDDSVQLYFELLSRDTAAAGARLHFQREPGQAVCLDCGATVEVHVPLCIECPVCGGQRLRITGGHGLRVESIEVEGNEDGGGPEPGPGPR